MDRVIAAIIGGIFLLISVWIGKGLNKASSPPEENPTKIEANIINSVDNSRKIEANIINSGDNSTITTIETQTINIGD